MAMIKAVNDYYDQLLHQKQYSEHTVNNYKRQILDFINYLAERVKDWPKVSSQDIRLWMAHHHRNGASAATIGLKLRHCAVFGLFGVTKNH